MEFSSWPENLPSDRQRAIEELIRGRQFANQLRYILGESEDGSVAAEDLVLKIINSFTNTLFMLGSSREPDEVSQVLAGKGGISPHWGGLKSEDSSETRGETSENKDRRGCYKRRKTTQTWTKLSPTLIDDGHAWRKYGQKVILNSHHPRNYYRCTHKFDQGCQATKQVQKTEDEPAMYKTTYNGHHTCQNLVKASQIILDTTSMDSSILLSFETKNPDQINPFFSSIPSVKQEYKEGQPTLNLHHSQPSSSDYLVSSDLMTFEASGGGTMTTHSGSMDHGDVISSSGVYSCTSSTQDFDMGMIMGADHFDNDFSFEF